MVRTNSIKLSDGAASLFDDRALHHSIPCSAWQSQDRSDVVLEVDRQCLRRIGDSDGNSHRLTARGDDDRRRPVGLRSEHPGRSDSHNPRLLGHELGVASEINITLATELPNDELLPRINASQLHLSGFDNDPHVSLSDGCVQEDDCSEKESVLHDETRN